MDFKRGDTTTHTLTIPLDMYEAGLRVFFMAKQAYDDDINDSAAAIHREFGDSDIIEKTTDTVVYALKFAPADTNKINLNGNAKMVLKGEFEFRYPDGKVKTFPDDARPMKVTIFSDIRRGNG